MTKPKKKVAPSTNITSALQKFFLAAIVLLFVMQIGQSSYYISMQLPENSNLSAYFSWFIGYAIMGLVWLTVYLSRRNRKLTLTTLFEVTLVTFSGAMIAMALAWLTTFVPLVYTNDNFYALNVIFVSLPWLITLPWLIIMIRRLRYNKKW